MIASSNRYRSLRWSSRVLAMLGICLTLASPLVAQQTDEDEAKMLFNGKDLTGWKVAQFGGEGEVTIKDGAIILGIGSPMTGVTLEDAELPTCDYEISLEAQRIDGHDFFCALTFPVADSHCTFVVGGWAGAVVGLSSIDGLDASDNDTKKLMRFESDRWYKIRVRVEAERIQAWIDKEQVVDKNIAGKKISIRPEVELNTPLGISAFQTIAGLKNIQLRELK